MPANRWIGYSRARQALAQLEVMLEREPGRVRPRCLLIVGPTNNGKTAIAEHFLHDHPQHVSADGEHECIPVLMVQTPPSPTVARLYGAILAALGVPGGLYSRPASPEATVLRLLRQVGCRMLVLDELHNLLAAPIPRQRELLNLLRYLGNELRIPLVCLGTREAYLAIRSDDQLENRFEPFLLPPWEDGPELGRLLASFEAVLPLREPSGLGAGDARACIAPVGGHNRRNRGPADLCNRNRAVGRRGADRGCDIGCGRVPAAQRAPAPVRARAAMTILSGDDLFPDRRWPLHPQPRNWEGLENGCAGSRPCTASATMPSSSMLSGAPGVERATWTGSPTRSWPVCQPARAYPSSECGR